MNDFDEKLSHLQTRLEKMVEYQNYFYREINFIRREIEALKQIAPSSTNRRQVESKYAEKAEPEFKPQIQPQTESKPEPELPPQQPNPDKVDLNQTSNAVRNQTPPPARQSPHIAEDRETERRAATAGGAKSGLEELIGRNLISIVGIIITIIGVGIGAKYAIDNNLISPVMRILAGYLFGIGLLGIAVWLKPKYINFSAVLLSGAMAISYFITYFAYGFYNLMPQTLAFALMVLITLATVAAAINYSRQVIAHIGLVGAYAVPFLLSGDSRNTTILLAYVAVINLGVLGVSLRKYWKTLFYSSFVFTWLIYSAVYLFSPFAAPLNFAELMIFAAIFFLTFYSTFLAYKLAAKELFGAENVLLLLANSFVFYGFGYALIQQQTGGERFLGLFTIINAALHFAVAQLVKRYAFVDKGSVNFLAALGLIFLTLAVPVELRGHWITLLWTAEAAILFYLGRAKKLSLYEYFAYPLMSLASASLLNEWSLASLSGNGAIRTPLLNAGFLTAILFAAGFIFIYFIGKKYQPAVRKPFNIAAQYLIPTILLVALYNAFRIEIDSYFSAELVRTSYNLSDGSSQQDYDLTLFNLIWQLNYSMLFLTLLAVVNARKFKSDVLGFITLGLSTFILLIFLVAGLYALGELRVSYLAQTNADIFHHGVFHLVIRYVSLAFVAALIFASSKYIKEHLNHKFPELKLNLGFDFVFYGSLLWLTSSELLNWADILRLADADKLGLSIWWGIYALVLVIIGIAQRKKHLRIGAIVLFAVTLVKLFFYDIASLGTISKTVVFVSLGILLLIISFLYNKYKHLIFDENEAEPTVADEAESLG